MVFERKKLKSAKLKKPLILHIKWLLFDQFNIKRLIFWVYMDSCMCIVAVQISVQKCVCLNYNKVPTLLTVDTKIDQKWSKMTKKSTKKGSAHCLKNIAKNMKNQWKTVLEPFFRHHPKKNWGTPVWQNGAWLSIKKHVFSTFFRQWPCTIQLGSLS